MRSIICSVAHASIRQNGPFSRPAIASRLGMSLFTLMYVDDLRTAAIRAISCPVNPESVVLGSGPLPSPDLSIVPILTPLKGAVPCAPGLVASPQDAGP